MSERRVYSADMLLVIKKNKTIREYLYAIRDILVDGNSKGQITTTLQRIEDKLIEFNPTWKEKYFS